MFKNTIQQSRFPKQFFDDNTVIVGTEERLALDSGRKVSKKYFLMTEQIVIDFVEKIIASGLDLNREFHAGAIIGRNIKNNRRYNWHTSRSLAFFARTGMYQIQCVNPDTKGPKRYIVIPDHNGKQH